jgi:CheY-like chemotaxis protein
MSVKTAPRILLVDDNEDAATLLADSLRALGHEVMVAHAGPAALAALGEYHPDVALLDLGLPVMDGFELADRLRADQAPKDLTLIALTGTLKKSTATAQRPLGSTCIWRNPSMCINWPS